MAFWQLCGQGCYEMACLTWKLMWSNFCKLWLTVWKLKISRKFLVCFIWFFVSYYKHVLAVVHVYLNIAVCLQRCSQKFSKGVTPCQSEVTQPDYHVVLTTCCRLGCLLEKGLQKGGARALQDSPQLWPWSFGFQECLLFTLANQPSMEITLIFTA